MTIASPPNDSAERGIFVNRTLNLRSVAAIGYDMDYTLIPYHTEEWEGAAFAHAVEELSERGINVEGLSFDADAYIQGLVIDLELGNLIKATRFGYVIQAAHGTTQLSFEQLRAAYSGDVVDLSESRFRFLNTLFSLSEAALFAQLVDRLDAGDIMTRAGTPMGYDELYETVSSAIGKVHNQGTLKAEIIADPDRFCSVDPDAAAALIDQRLAGKQLLLITNSDWTYTQPMMSWAFNDAVRQAGLEGVNGEATWRDLFDIVIVAADKPRFFSSTQSTFRMVDAERGLFEPYLGTFSAGEVYHGGCASLVEKSLGLMGDQILYVGDHLFGDVHVTKSSVQWRTALILREIESEIADAAAFGEGEVELHELMREKIRIETQMSQERMSATKAGTRRTDKLDDLYGALRRLDQRIAPLVMRSSSLGNQSWGPLMRAGSDKSLFARQVEKYADVYTSRVANFQLATPYAYLRAARTSLPHDSAG